MMKFFFHNLKIREFIIAILPYSISAVQHERAPRTYSKKPTYFSDLSAAAVAAGAAAAGNMFGNSNYSRNHAAAMMNPLIPPSLHPYYSTFPLHHFKSVFPSLFPPPMAAAAAAAASFYSPTTSTAAFTSSLAPTLQTANQSRSPSPKIATNLRQHFGKDSEDSEDDIAAEDTPVVENHCGGEAVESVAVKTEQQKIEAMEQEAASLHYKENGEIEGANDGKPTSSSPPPKGKQTFKIERIDRTFRTNPKFFLILTPGPAPRGRGV
jgi:hypothetical protein